MSIRFPDSRRRLGYGRSRLDRLRVAILGLLMICGCESTEPISIQFWAFGYEAEVAEELIADFHREHPDVRVDVQRIPWSAAHEKLVTAFAGDRLPDVCQLGSTWIPEFAALGALQDLRAPIDRSEQIRANHFFDGAWKANEIDGAIRGIPWYVDTRLVFYRRDLLEAAGYDRFPVTWEGWKECVTAVQSSMAAGCHAALLPINEFEPLVILGLQTCGQLLEEAGTRGSFRSSEFRRAFTFYVSLFQSGVAPPIAAPQIGNLWQELEAGRYGMIITGPWNIGVFRERLSATELAKWATAPMPGPDSGVEGVSLAGGSSLVLFENGNSTDASWRLIEYLCRNESQLRLYNLLGNLPAVRETWNAPSLTGDPWIVAFRKQMEHTIPPDAVPEWERIAVKIAESAQRVVLGESDVETALLTLDEQVNQILEKRRWMMSRHLAGARQP